MVWYILFLYTQSLFGGMVNNDINPIKAFQKKILRMNKFSELGELKHGVPYDSVLGPLLFLSTYKWLKYMPINQSIGFFLKNKIHIIR